MTDAQTSESKSLKTLFIIGFVLLAAWGGWALGRMGDDRARMKSEAESSVTEGRGVVKPAPVVARPAPVENPTPQATIPAAAAPVVVATPPAVKPVTAPATPVTPPAPTPEVVTPIGAPKLVIRSLPSAELLIKDASGLSRPFRTDAAGLFKSDALPAGNYTATVNHGDYLPPENPVAFKLTAGEATETSINATPKPASMIVLTDANATVFVDGVKVGGGGMVLLGGLPSKKALAVKITGTESKETSVTLSPRENRILDYRTAQAEETAVAGATDDKPSETDAARLAAIADKASDGTEVKAPVVSDTTSEKTGPGRTLEPASKEAPVVPKPPVTVTVKVISANAQSKLIAFSGPVKGKAPMETGKAGALRFPGVDAPMLVVKCVRTFGGVSVCEASMDGPIPTPISAEVTF